MTELETASLNSEGMLDADLNNLFANNRFSLLALHGELIAEWIENPENGPLLLHVSAALLDENFDDMLYDAFPDADFNFYSIQLNDDTEDAFYIIFMFHGSFYKIALFGEELSEDNYLEALENFIKNAKE